MFNPYENTVWVTELTAVTHQGYTSAGQRSLFPRPHRSATLTASGAPFSIQVESRMKPVENKFLVIRRPLVPLPENTSAVGIGHRLTPSSPLMPV